MPTAYLLLNTDIGREREVLQKIKHVDGVQEAFSLWGLYDIIARVKADTMDKLAQIISQFQISNIHTKLTVIVTEA